MSSYDVTRFTLTTTPELIADVEPSRKSATVKVPSNLQTVFIADDQASCNPQDGFQLTGDSIELEVNNAQIWARGLIGGEVIRLIREYTA